MDFDKKQWRGQHESEQQHSAKIPNLPFKPNQQPEQIGSVLPLFVSESNTKTSNLTVFPDSTPASTSLPRMLGYFSLAQRQELELQALIFRYMLAGAAVPQELLHPIQKSLLHSPPCFLHLPLQHHSHYQSAIMDSGYWGRAAMDPEPGRCRRTDGKKWRCSRDVVAGHKYCERHINRGRNRSRKPVEITATNSATAGRVSGGSGGCYGGILTTNTPRINDDQPLVTVASATNTHFTLSGPSPAIDLLHFNQSCSDPKSVDKGFNESPNEVKEDGTSDGHVLRHFFNVWPRSLQGPDNGRSNNSCQMSSSTLLSISIPDNSTPSDVSLKLSTGGGDADEASPGPHNGHPENRQPQLNWGAGWAHNQMASMGGPLAEALQSSNSYSSPMTGLHQLARGSVSETNFVST